MTSSSTVGLTISEIIYGIIGIIVYTAIGVNYIMKFGSRIKALEEKNKTHEEEKKDLNNSIILLKTENDVLSRSLTEGKEKFKRLDEIVEERQKQISDINSRCGVHSNQLSDLKLEHNTMSEKTRNIENKLAELTAMGTKTYELLQQLALQITAIKTKQGE